MAVEVTEIKGIKLEKIKLDSAKVRVVTPSSLELHFHENLGDKSYEVMVTALSDSEAGWQDNTHSRIHMLYSSKDKAQANKIYRSYQKGLRNGDYKLLLDWRGNLHLHVK